ncbi:MAG: tetratricopeptide repeat protein [Bacteroidales bacterium]|nr:tetratricopeptide repeat protein [Bacteroidales bacterium]
MAKATKTREEIRQENIETTVSSAEKFLTENKKKIWTVFWVVVLVSLAGLAYYKYVYKPAAEEAQQMAYLSEISFQEGNWEEALNGNDEAPGFASVIDEYGSKAGEAVYMYAGICELQLGNYESAINYLKQYGGKDPILKARALACLGDAYSELEQYEDACSAYAKAVAVADNDFAAGYLLKQGLSLRKLGKEAEAVKCFETIKNKYPQSVEAYDVDKFITSGE